LPATKLKKLTLARNKFTTFPTAILDLSACLEVLDLSGNHLEVLPPQIITLSRLEDLRLDNNKLIMLPSEIGHLQKLRTLHVCHNQLQTLPVQFLKNSIVDKMLLTGNRFTKKDFMDMEGYEEFAKRRTALKQKGMAVAAEISGMDLCGLDDA
jgi:Leucine-rich repeat (LRR) protein